MFVSLSEARNLATRALTKLGLSAEEADITADHLLDCELRGLGYSGLARIVSIAERVPPAGVSKEPITVRKETPVSALLDGGDNLGYLVARRATELVIGKASASGLGLVGAHNTWYTGMLSYYAEMATARDLVVFIASNATPWVAPYGGTEARFGTNPVCFGFPGNDGPVIWDIGTSEIIHAQVLLARRLGRELPPGVAFDAVGEPTTDPVRALSGAFAAWGGHKGSGLGIVVQLLGALAGSPILPGELHDFGFLVFAVQPGLLGSLDEFKQKVSDYAGVVRGTRPLAPDSPVRMPFDRSAARRGEQIRQGGFEVPDEVYRAVSALSE
ncbi:MAG TPA: Ldh family oxidoreductase [Trebonia sp.]